MSLPFCYPTTKSLAYRRHNSAIKSTAQVFDQVAFVNLNNHWKWVNAVSSLHKKKRQMNSCWGMMDQMHVQLPSLLIKSTKVFGHSLLLLLCPSTPQYNISHFRDSCGVGKPCCCLATSLAQWHRVAHDEETLLVPWVALNHSGCPTWKKKQLWIKVEQLFYENVINSRLTTITHF